MEIKRTGSHAHSGLLSIFMAVQLPCTSTCLIWNGKINPGKVFDLTLPMEQVAKSYQAMDERRAIKTLLIP